MQSSCLCIIKTENLPSPHLDDHAIRALESDADEALVGRAVALCDRRGALLTQPLEGLLYVTTDTLSLYKSQRSPLVRTRIGGLCRSSLEKMQTDPPPEPSCSR